VADVADVSAESILAAFGRPDVIWASPPCECFSVASIGHHWNADGTPKTPQTNCLAWTPRQPCRNGARCHEAAPRGSKTGTQGLKDSVQRAIVPRALCEELAAACDNGAGGQATLGAWFAARPAERPAAALRE